MSVGFESEEYRLRKLRAELAAMSDEELIKFGRLVRSLTIPKRVSPTPNPFERQLEVAKEEWRRRHPKKETNP